MNLFAIPPALNPAPFIRAVQAVADYQDRNRASAYPHDLHPSTVYAMNVHGIELHELDAWVALKASKQYTAAEAAEIIIRSRKGRA